MIIIHATALRRQLLEAPATALLHGIHSFVTSFCGRVQVPNSWAPGTR